jgi:hypothetical protein
VRAFGPNGIEQLVNRFEWNGLRRGDVVFVHQPLLTHQTAARGVIDSVTVLAHRGNDIGIRLDEGDGHVVWPAWPAVHRGPTDSGNCWRCDELANNPAVAS